MKQLRRWTFGEKLMQICKSKTWKHSWKDIRQYFITVRFRLTDINISLNVIENLRGE